MDVKYLPQMPDGDHRTYLFVAIDRATGERTPTGRHPLDRLCVEKHIDHRRIKPARPQTNGMVERVNGRIAEVLAVTRFLAGEHLDDTLQRCAALYNHHAPATQPRP
ncbi:MAG: integrase core domain-containing protein [Chromatiaceae bacterium]|nr:integrase core domain-containing protein [Chromatiaceae bacterium]